ncbi:replication protein A 70 kDa DNA-binding subunit, partial [Trifolium pratense]
MVLVRLALRKLLKCESIAAAGYWCESCQKNDEEINLRYIMVVRVSDASAEAYVSSFNDEAEKIILADEMDNLKSQEGEGNPYEIEAIYLDSTPLE